ncbi:hypothetical protein B5X24_HaOG200854 [Helicoverpa armigera]|nr:hypothetical protein B5X24_HaOG200854 [Helicoverpa armigera]
MTKRIVVLFYLTFHGSFIQLTDAENIPELYNFAVNKKYNTVGCINSILTKCFPCGSLTTFVNPNANMDQLIKTTNAENICHSIIVRSFDDCDWYIWTNVYVITAPDLLAFWFGMLDLSRDLFWNPRAKFIIQVDYLGANGEGIEDVFKIVIKHRMYNVVLLQNLKDDAVIYTYHPFENNSCGKRFDKIITLGKCENEDDIVDYFPNKIPSEMKNCTFNVVATDDVPNFISKSSNYTVYGKYVSGLEQFVLDTIAEREGSFVEYEVITGDATFGVVLPNRTTTGLLNYIDRNKADIAAGGFILMQNRVELFDYIWGFNYAAFYLYTPAAGNQVWRRVYREFGLRTWTLTGAALVLMIVVGLVIKRLINDKSFSVLYIWGYFFGNSNGGFSTHKKFKLLMLMWSFFAFCISSFYNTALVGLVSVHVQEQPHSLNVGNLKTLSYEPCISDNSRLFFQYAYNQTLPVGKDIHNCTNTDSSLELVASTKKYYAVEMEYSYKLKEYQYMDKQGKPKLESWLFSNTNVIVVYLVRGFPFIEKFQDYAHRLYESGLTLNHFKLISLRSYSVLQRHPKPFSVTKLLDLKMHFGILVAGWVLSFICFLLEIWYNNINISKKIQRVYVN